ncbi:3-phosphoshikimate 1-carboxyvinyltransferase [Propionispira raffinosivorans]|uniref:3-phosphoshikimate 1-carboxyvinyltransferase n=1 Tax=Propionispira raffinosivorans TaxID=86959 RepID=UPI00035F4DEF|nr:3-phosphoshikimate 1-carboxyvinyltransferase [Propionispira raffinosivorans]
MGGNKTVDSLKHGICGEIFIPGDKSISHRSVMFSSLGDRAVRIRNFLNAQDCMSTVACMRSLGIQIDQIGPTEFIVHGKGLHGLQEPQCIVDAGNSGTTLRLMMGILAPQPFLTTFTGDASLHKRPMGRVIKPLSAMGAHIVGRESAKFLPVTLIPTQKLKGIDYQMPMASAQVKSAVLLAGMYADGETRVTEPYTSRDHTEKMLETFGVALDKEGTSITIKAVDSFHAPELIEVPGDISSAAFWLVAASIIPGSELTLRNVGVNPTRTGILDVLIDMGADITLINKRFSGKEPVADIVVKSAALHGTTFGAKIIPRLVDEIPVIAVAAMFAEGETVITGAGELRVKETDRLQAITTEFNKLADCIIAAEDGLTIKGSAKLKAASCLSYHDHRIAMALAIAGAAGAGVTIDNAECVNISYPEFYATLETLRKG